MRIVVAIVALAATVLAVSGATPQTVQQPGRFQLVAEPNTTVFLLDTATGRVWRYSRLTQGPESELVPVCKGVENCFLEIERKRLTKTGYVSEAVP